MLDVPHALEPSNDHQTSDVIRKLSMIGTDIIAITPAVQTAEAKAGVVSISFARTRRTTMALSNGKGSQALSNERVA